MRRWRSMGDLTVVRSGEERRGEMGEGGRTSVGWEAERARAARGSVGIMTCGGGVLRTEDGRKETRGRLRPTLEEEGVGEREEGMEREMLAVSEEMRDISDETW